MLWSVLWFKDQRVAVQSLDHMRAGRRRCVTLLIPCGPQRAPVVNAGGAISLPLINVDVLTNVKTVEINARRMTPVQSLQSVQSLQLVPNQDGAAPDAGGEDGLCRTAPACVGRQARSGTTQGQHQQIKGAAQQLQCHHQARCKPPSHAAIDAAAHVDLLCFDECFDGRTV